MTRTKRGTSRVIPFPVTQFCQKVEFPSLDRFIEEAVNLDVRIVRIDVFQESRPSELSFVYYTTLTLYVTAQDSSGKILYEYVQPLSTTANTEPKFTNEEALRAAQATLTNTVETLASHGLETLGGRYTLHVEE